MVWVCAVYEQLVTLIGCMRIIWLRTNKLLGWLGGHEIFRVFAHLQSTGINPLIIMYRCILSTGPDVTDLDHVFFLFFSFVKETS